MDAICVASGHHSATNPLFKKNLAKYHHDINPNDYSDCNLDEVKGILRQAAKDARSELLSSSATTPQLFISEAF